MNKTMLKGIFLSAAVMLSATVYSQTKSPFIYESGNTTIKLGGFIRTVALYDFKGSVQNNDFVNSTISIPSNWEYQKRTSYDASASRLGLKITQNIEKFGPLDIYFEMDFRGANDVLRLRQAYVAFSGFTLGQTWSFWYDAASMPAMIDIQGVNSRTFLRTPLLGYTAKIGKDLTFGVSLEIPKAKITTATGYKSVNQTTPDIPFFLQYKGKSGHIKAAGIFRTITYGVTSDEELKSASAFGAQLSGSLKVVKNFTLYSNGIYGKGVARYINDLGALNLDLVPNQDNGGMQVIPMWGVSLGLKADLSQKIYCTSTYSVAGINSDYNYYSANEYLKGDYFSATMFWNVAKNLSIAGEYLHGKRVNMNHASAEANRLQMMVMYTF